MGIIGDPGERAADKQREIERTATTKTIEGKPEHADAKREAAERMTKALTGESEAQDKGEEALKALVGATSEIMKAVAPPAIKEEQPPAPQGVPRWFIQVLEVMVALYPSTAPRELAGGIWWEYLRAVVSPETFPLAVQRAVGACDPMTIPSAELIRRAAVQVQQEHSATT